MKLQLLIASFCLASSLIRAAEANNDSPKKSRHPNSTVNALAMMREGQNIFRYDTFGDEAFWGGQLRLHETVATLSPSAALGLGLKVDSRAVPPNVLQQIRKGKLNLDDPNNTLALL